jgi:uncharacterized protein (TIGR00299 family) protein
VAARRISKKAAELIIIDPAGGLAGDMFLAGLFALGADPARVAREVRTLPGLERFSIGVGRVKRGAIAASRMTVRSPRAAAERDLAAILRMIERSRLEARVKELASKTFRIIGSAEGKIHGVRARRVHFHEVGAVDSIVDIVGAVVALSHLGFPTLYHLPFKLGHGFVSVAHGRLPLPAPATIEILRGRTVQCIDEEGETVTPTGAALMKALARELPAETRFRPLRVVYAAGTRENGAPPGLLRLIVGDPQSLRHPVAVIRTTIDDMNPQLYGYVQERLFEAGALEVYLGHVSMKKGRPGVELTVIGEVEAADDLFAVLFGETTTIGARMSVEAREELERWTERVRTPFGLIQVKKSRLGDGTVKISPEYESCRIAARKRGVSLAAVSEAARAAAMRRGGER